VETTEVVAEEATDEASAEEGTEEKKD